MQAMQIGRVRVGLRAREPFFVKSTTSASLGEQNTLAIVGGEPALPHIKTWLQLRVVESVDNRRMVTTRGFLLPNDLPVHLEIDGKC